MNKNWKRWKMGWGETLELAPGLKISVSKGMTKGSEFSFNVFGLNSKRQYDTMDEAKIQAEGLARQILVQAIDKMNDDNSKK